MTTAKLVLQLSGCNLTIKRNDNELFSNLTGNQSIDIDTSLPATFIINFYKYMNTDDIPELRTFNRYSSEFTLNTESFTMSETSSKRFELTTDFERINTLTANNPDNEYRLGLRCRCVASTAYVSVNLKNCRCNYSKGEYLPVSTTFIVECDSNYEFQEIPYIVYGSSNYNAKSEYLEKVDDTTYKITLSLKTEYDYIITGEGIKKSNITERYGLFTAYKADKHDLQMLAQIRFQEVKIEPYTVGGQTIAPAYMTVDDKYIDTAKYIVSLIKIYVDIQATEKANVKLGAYDTELECYVIEDDLITLDFGSVEVKGIYGTAIDYDDTDMQIYLPYLGFTKIEPVDFMNKKVSLKYQVNILNGDSLAILYADDDVIATYTCNIAIQVPYQLNSGEYTQTAINPNSNYLYKSKPFLYVKTHKPVDDGNIPYRNTSFYSILGDLSGYTEASEIAYKVISDFITLSEIEEIKSLIAQGVII